MLECWNNGIMEEERRDIFKRETLNEKRKTKNAKQYFDPNMNLYKKDYDNL